jgi:hypothetical protein
MGVIVRSDLGHKRVHVPAHGWGHTPGTDFWFIPEGEQLTSGELLSDRGWTVTSVSLVAGTGADFISSSDVGVPGHVLTNSGSDLIQSPAVFGDYYHAYQAGKFLGSTPSQLNVEFAAAFSVQSANESNTGFGLLEAGGAITTVDSHMAIIHTNGSNFALRSGADSDTGASDDSDWHLWRITVTSSNIEWFIDGTSQGTIDLQTDLWPVSFSAGVQGGGTNRVLLGQVHIWYS